MQVAVGPDQATRRRPLGEDAHALPDLVGAAAHGFGGGVVGERGEDLVELLLGARDEEAEVLGSGFLGRERGLARVRSEREVHRADDLTHRAGVLREGVGPHGQLVEGERPPVDGAGEEALEHAERGAELVAGVAVPADELGDVLEAVLGEEQEQFQLGVQTCLDVAVDLQQHLVEDDRGVRLLRAEQTGDGGGVDGDRRDEAEVDAATGGRDDVAPDGGAREGERERGACSTSWTIAPAAERNARPLPSPPGAGVPGSGSPTSSW